MHTDHDVIVIGGGPAGLAAATTLARARRDVLVLDTAEPRNAAAHAVHAFLSRDGASPRELLAVGRDELLRYGGHFRLVGARTARRVEDGFEVSLDDGSVVSARRLVVTTGLVDEVPDIPGLRELWGTGAVHCPYCHGWEVRERALAVIATGPMAAHQALLFSQWSDDVSLLLDGRPAPEGAEAARLAAVGVRVVEGRVERVDSSGGVVSGVAVATEQGSVVVPCAAVVVGPRFAARSAVLESLGVEAVDFMIGEVSVGTHVPSDPMGGQTSVQGVYVAGNVTEPQAQVIHAAGAGVRTAALLNMELIVEDADRLVAASAQPAAGGASSSTSSSPSMTVHPRSRTSA